MWWNRKERGCWGVRTQFHKHHKSLRKNLSIKMIELGICMHCHYHLISSLYWSGQRLENIGRMTKAKPSFEAQQYVSAEGDRYVPKFVSQYPHSLVGWRLSTCLVFFFFWYTSTCLICVKQRDRNKFLYVVNVIFSPIILA